MLALLKIQIIFHPTLVSWSFRGTLQLYCTILCLIFFCIFGIEFYNVSQEFVNMMDFSWFLQKYYSSYFWNSNNHVHLADEGRKWCSLFYVHFFLFPFFCLLMGQGQFFFSLCGLTPFSPYILNWCCLFADLFCSIKLPSLHLLPLLLLLVLFSVGAWL